MSPSPQLTPAGSSSYSSDTMTVGDGTWDTSRNTFLLPNLVGLNFDTMRYNGMGNRFRELAGYFNLIQAHGILAAITFLFIVPTAILTLRFYGRNPRFALRIHIWLQILTVLLTTVIFVLGWIAVGPSRKLTNPHHGIGLAIYVMVLAQFIWGWWMHRREKMKKQLYEPLKVMFHHWLGRAIALLGLAQIPLGLTLYGSPVVLFVLYTLAVFALLVIYFILTHIRERRGDNGYDTRYGYGAGSAVEERRHSGRSGNLVKGALAGAGIYALANRFRRRSGGEGAVVEHSHGHGSRPEVVGSQRHSGSYSEDEKYPQFGRGPDRSARWEDRLLRIAAPIGAAGLVERYYDRRYRDRDSDNGQYGPRLGGETAINEGRHGEIRPYSGSVPPDQPMQGGPGPYGHPGPGGPLPSGQHPLNRPSSRRSSVSYPYSDFPSASGEPRRGHGLRNDLATLGVLGVARSIFNGRRGRREDEQLQEEHESRAHGQHFTGDGRPPRHHRPGTSTISTDTSVTGQQSHDVQGIPPIPTGTYGGGGGGAGTFVPADVAAERERRRQEALPLGGVIRPVSMPPIPHDPQGLFHTETESGSESYNSPGGRRRHRLHAGRDAAAAGILGGAAGLAAGEASSSRRDRQEDRREERREERQEERQEARQEDRQEARQGVRQTIAIGEGGATASPPVSVKVHMHNDGRHVTLRRLPEEEAAAEREARRRARRDRGDSGSSLSGDGGGPRFRRRDAQEQENAEAMRIESERLAAARAQAQNPNIPSNVPLPPPIPESSGTLRPGPAGSVGTLASPGDGVTTDASADYANNRRRRRAERAQAKEAKLTRDNGGGRGGKTVGFE